MFKPMSAIQHYVQDVGGRYQLGSQANQYNPQQILVNAIIGAKDGTQGGLGTQSGWPTAADFQQIFAASGFVTNVSSQTYMFYIKRLSSKISVRNIANNPTFVKIWRHRITHDIQTTPD